MPTFSIIIPVYKVEEYLNKCVDSVLAQTFTDYEVVLVDDGSPDNCGKICDEYALKDSRIKVIHKQNGGLSSARNAGLDIATGKYIYFLDSDDYIKQDLLEKVLPKFDDDNTDLVVFGACLFYPDGREELRTFEPAEYVVTSRERFIYDVVLPYSIGCEACFRVFKREIIDKYNLRFENNKEIFAEDLCFMLYYGLHVRKVSVIEDVLYYYLQRENSIMGKEYKLNNASRRALLIEKFYNYYCTVEDKGKVDLTFPVICYFMMHNEFMKIVRLYKVGYMKSIDVLKDSVNNKEFFMGQMTALSTAKTNSKMCRFVGKQNFVKWRNFARYYVKGKRTYRKFIAKLIGLAIKIKII